MFVCVCVCFLFIIIIIIATVQGAPVLAADFSPLEEKKKKEKPLLGPKKKNLSDFTSVKKLVPLTAHSFFFFFWFLLGGGGGGKNWGGGGGFFFFFFFSSVKASLSLYSLFFRSNKTAEGNSTALVARACSSSQAVLFSVASLEAK